MKEARNESPSSDVFSDGMDSLSMRDKSLIKRSVSKHHNNNFTAGYVPVHEQHLQKTGLRGRKTFAFWTLVGLLFVLAIGNLTLTMTILGVLRLGQGMQSLELVPEQSAIKLFGNADLNDIYKRDGRIEGFKDYPVDITGYNSSLHIKPNSPIRNPSIFSTSCASACRRATSSRYPSPRTTIESSATTSTYRNSIPAPRSSSNLYSPKIKKNSLIMTLLAWQ